MSISRFPFSLREAKAGPNGYVVLDGESGAWLYLVCPANLVVCDERTLGLLASDLEDAIFPGDTSGASVRYEWLDLDEELDDHGMGEESGIALGTVWFPKWLLEAGVGERIQHVIEGKVPRLDLSSHQKALIKVLHDEYHTEKFEEEIGRR